MDKSKRKSESRQKRDMQKSRLMEKKKTLQAELASLESAESLEIGDEVELPEADETATADTKELVEKDDMTGAMQCDPGIPMAGPVSWEELDQSRLERERAYALSDTTWDVRSLVNNILSSPLDISAKAAAIKEVGTGFSDRAAEILGAKTDAEIDAVDDPEEDEKDLDLLALQGLLAYDKRNASVVDVIKAKLTSAQSNNLSDGSFALVRTENGKDGKKTKVRKYPIHDASHVRNALARAAQQIKGGNATDAADARAALPKIHAAAKKFGIDAGMKKERNAILVEKDAKGDWRWVGWVSNNFQDWDGDIISKEAHEEYVAWWEKNQDVSPVFVSWHTPGTVRKHPVDFMTFEKGFLIASGKLEPEEAEGLLKAQAIADQGMSHGTLIFSRDSKDPRIITKYRMYECSDLPLANAANPFTDFETLVKEVGMDKKEYLTQILGSTEKAEAFLVRTGLKQKALQEVGVEEKEKTDAAPAPVATSTPTTPEQQALVEKVLKELDVEGLNEFVTKASEAMERVLVLEGVIKDLQAEVEQTKKDEDQKLADKLTPPVGRFAWSQKTRPTTSDKTVVDENDELAHAAPGVPEGYWLSEVTGTIPVAIPEKA